MFVTIIGAGPRNDKPVCSGMNKYAPGTENVEMDDEVAEILIERGWVKEYKRRGRPPKAEAATEDVVVNDVLMNEENDEPKAAD